MTSRGATMKLDNADECYVFLKNAMHQNLPGDQPSYRARRNDLESRPLYIVSDSKR